MIERRFSTTTFRTEKVSGAKFLMGYAARYDSPSPDYGGFTEVIKPGAFTRALREKQDVRHLINHQPSELLGRTTAGTTVLTEDSTGLHFRTRVGNRSYERDLLESLDRGDIDGCSFAFSCVKDNWTDQKRADGTRGYLRELQDLDLGDVSVVTYPFYSDSNFGVSVADRSLMFPLGVPTEVRAHLLGQGQRDADDADETGCGCGCAACEDNDCASCFDPDCRDANCTGVVQAAHQAAAARLTAHGVGKFDSIDDDDDQDDDRARRLRLALASW